MIDLVDDEERTEQLTLSTTPQIRSYLEELTASGHYGRTIGETAYLLIKQSLVEKAELGWVDRDLLADDKKNDGLVK